ncbi:MAG: hypothetical protein WD771_01975 [Gemmatimonadaceae bacterium]
MYLLRSAFALGLWATIAHAQTDYYNTDRGRPLAVEDAVVVERRAFEFQLMPLRLERPTPGLTVWGYAPAFAWGILPRTQVEVEFPLLLRAVEGLPNTGPGGAGIELELLHQLNTESLPFPGFALGAGVHLPTGPFGPSRAIPVLRGAATRTLGWGRLHANVAYSPGQALAPADNGGSSRWFAGFAVDHTFALRQLLVGVDLTAEESLRDDGVVVWRSTVGVRRQMTSRLAMDLGLFQRLATGDPEWGLTLGGAFAFGQRTVPSRPSSPRVSTGAWSTVYEQHQLQAPHNFAFRRRYPNADRLFNAFDYGHAILYETLYRSLDEAPQLLEDREYRFLTEELLVRPPRLPVAEDAIEPIYARLAPEAKAMFEWAHVLHRQVYDILADERLDAAAKGREMARLEAYYLSRRDLAFSTHPKTMALMQEQPYSLAFRQGFPKFNGLIWAYHWLQVGLYEPLLVGRTAEERQALVAATVARFRQMLPDAPNGFPVVMPMTAAIAPRFAERWPTLAIIFDNLHSMHDVISDILANPAVAPGEKRSKILKAAAAFRDDTTEVMTVAGWRRMSEMMGLHNQGGPAVGFAPELPTPTVPRGFVMRHDKDGNPIGAHDHP